MSISRLICSLFALMTFAVQATAAEVIAGNPLIPIAGGPFVFGNDRGNLNERPQTIVTGKPFAMNRTEISNGQYQRFVAATGHRASFYASHPQLGLDDHPVVGVSFEDANAYCAYYGLVLPSEQQYERAARGTKGLMFPWGDAPADPSHANGGSTTCCSSDDGDGYALTARVDAFPQGATREGIFNLVGNVWEWTRDYYAPYGGTADPAAKFRVLRGGAWNSDAAHLSTTYRLAYDPEFRFAANGGFRCVSPEG